MKKVIFTITLLFSHVSFGLDALDGNSILCERTKGNGYAVVGFKFVGHNVIRNTVSYENDKVLIKQDYGNDRTSTNPLPVDLITQNFVRFWTETYSGGNQSHYNLNRETLELKSMFSTVETGSFNCSVYMEIDD